MRTLIARILTPALLAVLCLAGLAPAQTAQRVIRVTVPFEFTIGDKIFPAGDYSLVRAAQDRLDLRDSHAHVLLSILTHSVQSLEKSASTKLEFSEAVGGRALARVWVENEEIGYELATPNAASAVARRRSRESGQSAEAAAR